MIDGARKARLYDNVTEWSTPGFSMNANRGEKTGRLRLPNLSTRPPRTIRNGSRMISSCR